MPWGYHVREVIEFIYKEFFRAHFLESGAKEDDKGVQHLELLLETPQVAPENE